VIGTSPTLQAQLVSDLIVGNDSTVTIVNSAVNSGNESAANNVGYFWDQQLCVGGNFQAGDNLTMAATNSGTDSSTGTLTNYVAIIDSGSGQGSR